jgi:hypothetical protein
MSGNSASYNLLKTKKMRMRLKMLAVFYKDCYIPYPWLDIQDVDKKISKKIISDLKSSGITINFTHFIIKCEVGGGVDYLGYNWKPVVTKGYNWRNEEFSIGSTIETIGDSEEILLKEPKMLYLYL